MMHCLALWLALCQGQHPLTSKLFTKSSMLRRVICPKFNCSLARRAFMSIYHTPSISCISKNKVKRAVIQKAIAFFRKKQSSSIEKLTTSVPLSYSQLNSWSFVVGTTIMALCLVFFDGTPDTNKTVS